MKIYNSLSRKIEHFEPINETQVRFFVCGPTVYDYAHIGNAKTYTQFDFIAKYFRYRGYDVFYLQNITDIDDKIIKRSQEDGTSWKDISDLYTQIYLEDMLALGNDAVDRYARATDHIGEIVDQVKRLEEKGVAYRTSDGIYYEIASFPDYGKLSGRTEQEATDSVSRIDASAEKRGWNDFCLWKYSKPGEPHWETELGSGRPGWHIEDTAITEAFLGPQYDVHGGAVDLIFPHHEAEIAQMEVASGKSPLVRYWMHTGFLNTSSLKMSKSAGNFLTIREVLGKYNYRVLRLMYLSGHYRSSLEFSDDTLEQAKNTLKRIDEFVFSIRPELENKEEEEAVKGLRERVIEVLDNDFNTPQAMSHIYSFIRDRNAKGHPGKAVKQYFQEINTFFGFFEFELQGDAQIDELVRRRDEYRKVKEYQKADEIRKLLIDRGIQLYDSINGTKWRKID